MKILLNILTHGDELIGLRVAEEVEKLRIDQQIVSIQIANQEAYELGKRFIDQDLNRSFPGKIDGNHEQRLAHQLLSNIKAADMVIDIHSTQSQLKDAVIVTKLDDATMECLSAINPKYVLVMEATKDNALISQAKIGIAFEYGQEQDEEVVGKVVTGIKRLFCHLGVLATPQPAKEQTTQYFKVTAQVEKPAGYRLSAQVENFTQVCKGEVFAVNSTKSLVADEDFYPILFGQDNYEDIFGFKGIKIPNLN